MNGGRPTALGAWPRRLVWIFVAVGMALAAGGIVAWAWHRQPGPIRFRNITANTGVDFVHTDGSGGRKYIVETVTSGLATFDYDGDGLVDIYFPNGRPLPGTPPPPEPPRNRLYRNVGGMRFVDVTEQAGVGDAGYGLGVAVGDFDNDGWPDLYVSNFGPKKLYHNNGDGTFSDVTDRAGVADGSQVGAGAAFLDMEGDGDLDLYVANYVDFSFDKHVTRVWDGLPIYPGPVEFAPTRDTLFRNNGDGTFTDVSDASGIADHPGTGMGMVCADYDDDGDTDIFVLNDVFGNSCFENDGHGHFAEVGVRNGFKYNGSGMELGSMGVDCGDYDNDGLLDLFQTSYQGELCVLFHNLGQGIFEDATTVSGAGQGSRHNVKWGCALADFDNDGWRDLFVGMGHLHDNIEAYDRSSTYEDYSVLLRNLGDGTFADVSRQAGDGLRVRTVVRGVACDDLDNDGRLDLAILASRRPALVLHNETRNANHWLQMVLRGTTTNRDGVGARVRVIAGDRVWVDEVHSGRGYQSHFGSRLHFGLGACDRVERIEVRWIGGRQETFPGCPANQVLTVVEGTGQTIEPSLQTSGAAASDP